MSAGIYKITNLVTKQIYVGYSVNLKKRELDYRYNKVSGQTLIHDSIRNHGFHNHKFEILIDFDDITPTKFELKKFESVFIAFYKKVRGCAMLNCNDGGGGRGKWTDDQKKKKSIASKGFGRKKPILQYDFDGVFVKEWNSLTDASNTLLLDYNLLVKSCKAIKNNRSVGGYQWRYKTTDQFPLNIGAYKLNVTTKEILQYDLDGNFIQEWDAVLKAKKGAKVTMKEIYSSIRGETNKKFFRVDQKYQWKHKTENYPLKIEKSIAPVIVQYGLDGNLIKIWKNTNEIVKELGIKMKNLRGCICGANKKTAGFQWKRFFDNEYPLTVENLVKIKHVYDPKDEIKLMQYDLFGTYLKSWDSCDDAENETGVAASSIYACCKEKQKRAGNFQWRFKKADEQQNISPVWIISQYHPNGTLIKDWVGLREIKEKTGYDPSNISSCLSGRIKHAYNFNWKYK